MVILPAILGASFLLCLALTPLARVLALRYGLVDRPDARRKLHARPVPLTGGLAMVLSGCLVLGAALLASPALQEKFGGHSFYLLGLLLAALLICALGVLDDFGRLRGRHKLLGQVVAAVIVVCFGVQVRNLNVFGVDVELGILSVPFTIFWILAVINSLNLLDGMDGLLGCVGVITSSALAVLAVLGGHWTAACVAAALAGNLLGFLRYNLPPARVFLGDAGSMLTGLVIGVLAIQTSLQGPGTMVLIPALAVLAVPFFDTLAAVVRRKLTGRSIYTTDRGHLHHCLLRRGYSTRRVLLLVSTFCLLTALGGVASRVWGKDVIGVLAALAVVDVFIVTRLFGHGEFELLQKRLARLLPWRSRPVGAAHELEVHLQGSGGWKGLMASVTATAPDLNLRSVRLDINAPALHEEYHAHWERCEKEQEHIYFWTAELPLSIEGRAVGRLALSGYQDARPMWEKLAAVTKLMDAFEQAMSSGEVPCLTVPVKAPVPKRRTGLYLPVGRDREKELAGSV